MGGTRKRSRSSLFFAIIPGGDIDPGGKQDNMTHTTHMKRGQDLQAVVQEGEEWRGEKG